MNSGKVTVYLDQNIVGYIRDGLISLPDKGNIAWIYSNEHLNEIGRSNDLSFLSPFEKLEARRVQFIVDSNFNFSNGFYFEEYRNPIDVYNEFMSETSQYPDFSLPALQAFLLGNISELNPDLYVEEMITKLLNLLPESLETRALITKITEIMKNFRNVLIDSKDKVLPINELREMIANEQFSDLSPKNERIIDQIWEKIKTGFLDFSQDELFGKTTPRFFGTNPNWSILNKISWCYSFLNVLGYWPDKHISKIASIISFNSDALHVAYSSCCDALLTADKRLAKKASATFDYFNISTEILTLELKARSD